MCNSFRLALSLCMLGVIAPAQSVPNSNQLIYTYPRAIEGLGLYGVRNRVELFDALGKPSQAFTQAISSESNFVNLRPAGFERPFNLGIAVQLSALPIASPASGVIFQEDKTTGAMLPASDSLAPILTERAETIVQKRL